MRQRLWREYLNHSVKQRILSEAHRMASVLQTYIDLFLPESSRSVNRRYNLDEGVISVPARDPPKDPARRRATAAETVPDVTDATPFVFTEPISHVHLRESLVRLLEIALLWRAEISIGLDEQCDFSWPIFRDAYESDRSYRQTRTRKRNPARQCRCFWDFRRWCGARRGSWSARKILGILKWSVEVKYAGCKWRICTFWRRGTSCHMFWILEEGAGRLLHRCHLWRGEQGKDQNGAKTKGHRMAQDLKME